MLLDVTHTLHRAWRSPVGLTRVEAEVIEVLRSSPGIAVQLVRHDPALGTFRPLTAAELEWLDSRRGGTAPVAHPPCSPPDTGWREFVLALLGRLSLSLPAWGRRVAQPIWSRLLRYRQALHRGRHAGASREAGSPLLAGDVLICPSNPWDHTAPEIFSAWRASGQRRVVMVLHDLLPWEVPQLTAGREVRSHVAQMLSVLAHADRIVAVSSHSRASYARAMAERGCDTAPVVVARPPIAASLWESDAARPTGLGDDRPFVLFCSTIEIRKNHALLLALWDRLREALPETRLPRLVFAGRWGWGVDAVRLAVERNWRLRPHLCVLESVSDPELAWLYRHAVFTLFPSFAEGYGMPVAESLASSTPVVIADHPALHEASEGLMPAIDPLDFPAWEREIVRLLTDAAYLEELRRRARQYTGPRPGELGRAVASLARDLCVEADALGPPLTTVS